MVGFPVAKRADGGGRPSRFLINEKYLEYLNNEELDESLNGLNSNLPTELQKFLKEECLPSDELNLLRDLTHAGSRYAEIVLFKKITELANSGNYNDFVKIIEDDYLYYLSEENFVRFFYNSGTDFLLDLFEAIDYNPIYDNEYEYEEDDDLNLKYACEDIIDKIKNLPPKLYSKWIGNILRNANKELCDLLLKFKFFEILTSSSYYKGLKDFLKDKNFILYNYIALYKKKIYTLKPNNEILIMNYSNIVGTLDVKDIIGINNHTSLKKLNLSNNKITKIKGLKNLKNLELLDLSNNKITEIKGLDSLINLKSLNLGGNEFKTIKSLNYLRNLRELKLGNKITEIKGLEHLEKLESLDLASNSISEIKGLDSLHKLGTLNLNNNQISEIKGIEMLKSLINLRLANNPIPKNILDDYGGLDAMGTINDAQWVVYSCRQKKAKSEKLEKDLIEKIKKIIKVSTRFRLDMMRDILGIDEIIFNDKILNWARDFNFKIEGDYLIINKNTALDLINEFEKQFKMWEKPEKEKIKKI